MVRLTRIYTRGGDKGKTSLGNGDRVDKADPRVAAYGTVDEANAALGVARLHAKGDIAAMLIRLQNDLFDLGADLCTPGPDPEDAPRLRIAEEQIARLEAEIDAMNETLAPLESFILPGGSPLGAQLHVARGILRRAERIAAEAMKTTDIGENAFRFMNRASDHLFVLARYANRAAGVTDPLWQPGLTRNQNDK